MDVMAEHPELWTERTPAPRHLFDRAPAFGLAGEVERLSQEAAPDPVPLEPRKPPRERGPFLTYLCLPWSYGDRRRGDRWRRMQCRRRRHEMTGGHPMQVGGDITFIERRCRWCGAEAEPR